MCLKHLKFIIINCLNARKKGEPQDILEVYEREYKEQQIRTSKMSGNKKGEWEKRKIIGTKTDRKKFWNLIKRFTREI